MVYRLKSIDLVCVSLLVFEPTEYHSVTIYDYRRIYDSYELEFVYWMKHIIAELYH